MSLESTVVWIKNTLVPEMLSNVTDWKGKTVADYQVVPMSMNKDGFASLLFAIDLCLNSDGKQDSRNLIVKVMFSDEKLRALFQSEKQFANEIFFYSSVVPLFESTVEAHALVESLFPKFFYSSVPSETECREGNRFIVVENLKPRGFRLGDRTSLDLDHCILALQNIGRFHGLSYALKHRNGEAFSRDVVSKICETVQASEFCLYVGMHNKRVSEALKLLLPDDSIAETLERKVTDPSVYESLIKPKEPLSVLCHGDFCRNNIMFKYDNSNTPCELKLLDFQTIRYASPAIDLSFFLFMNTTVEFRKQYWDRLFECYHEEVIRTMANILDKSEESLNPCYSLQAFKEDFRQHAFYGYIITVTFLPLMLACDEEREEMTQAIQEDITTNFSKVQEVMNRVGGPEATDALIALVLEMRERSFI